LRFDPHQFLQALDILLEEETGLERLSEKLEDFGSPAVTEGIFQLLEQLSKKQFFLCPSIRLSMFQHNS